MQQITLTTFSSKHLIFLTSLAFGLVATATSARSEPPEPPRPDSRSAGSPTHGSPTQVKATDNLAVQVELLTMGPGPKLFARFGHAALRVRRADGFDRVYNFGYTRFDNPWLVWDFLRGAALFWAESSSWPETVLNYQDDDRTLMRQVLNLTSAESHALARRLERAVGPKSHYVYDHFANNCSTRLRDLIDDATGHALRRALRQKPVKGTLRDRVREGFAGRLDILVGIALVMGHETDRPITRWEATFLPAELSTALHDVKHHGQPLAGPPIVVTKRRGPKPNPGDPRAGVLILWLVTMGLLILGGMGLLALRNGQRRASLAVLFLALVLGVLSLPPRASPPSPPTSSPSSSGPQISSSPASPSASFADASSPDAGSEVTSPSASASSPSPSFSTSPDGSTSPSSGASSPPQASPSSG